MCWVQKVFTYNSFLTSQFTYSQNTFALILQRRECSTELELEAIYLSFQFKAPLTLLVYEDQVQFFLCDKIKKALPRNWETCFLFIYLLATVTTLSLIFFFNCKIGDNTICPLYFTRCCKVQMRWSFENYKR